MSTPGRQHTSVQGDTRCISLAGGGVAPSSGCPSLCGPKRNVTTPTRQRLYQIVAQIVSRLSCARVLSVCVAIGQDGQRPTPSTGGDASAAPRPRVRGSAFRRVVTNKGRKMLMSAEMGQLTAVLHAAEFQEDPFAAVQVRTAGRPTLFVKEGIGLVSPRPSATVLCHGYMVFWPRPARPSFYSILSGGGGGGCFAPDRWFVFSSPILHLGEDEICVDFSFQRAASSIASVSIRRHIFGKRLSPPRPRPPATRRRGPLRRRIRRSRRSGTIPRRRD